MQEEMEYAGFWSRVLAMVIDVGLIWMITLPLLHLAYGDKYWDTGQVFYGPVDLVLTYVFPAIVILGFWIKWQATPGKRLIGSRIVDETTGAAPETKQLVIRYLTYYLSALPVGLGFFWVVLDSKKQGWHDKLAGTVVIRKRRRIATPVQFMQ